MAEVPKPIPRDWYWNLIAADCFCDHHSKNKALQTGVINRFVA
jgi:hypothetical protein